MAVPDCFADSDACGEDEWCLLADEVRMGPWAMGGSSGETPNFGRYDCSFLARHNFTQLFAQVCRNRTEWGPWPMARGRCVRYRREQQSCKVYWGGGGAEDGGLSPQYVVEPATGRPPSRPLLCAPGLVCTGATEPVLFTCVKARPADVCYQGPWWNSSSWCRSQLPARERAAGGLSRLELEQAARALIIQLPVEIYKGPSHRRFWEDPAAQRARGIAQAAVQALWPDAYRAATRFPLALPNPLDPVGGQAAPQEGSAEWNRTVADAEALYRQPGRVWAAIHVLVHNAHDPLRPAQALASRSLAAWLRQHFMCCNCRGFWAVDVLNAVGLPPEAAEREAHKRWWWRAHNMASEHSAATRGGHPWLWPAATDAEMAAQFGRYSDRIRCQNPWFLPYEEAERMWTIQEQGAGQREKASVAR